jgi:ribosome biogenesis GTPase
MVGQSGIGKSSLINALVPGASVEVGKLSPATDEGKHTTTASVMHKLPNGGRLIDTPGVREFIPHISDSRNVQAGFREIIDAAEKCRFSDCQHLREPDCAVKNLVTSGKIGRRRYESYKRLIHKNRSQKSA